MVVVVVVVVASGGDVVVVVGADVVLVVGGGTTTAAVIEAGTVVDVVVVVLTALAPTVAGTSTTADSVGAGAGTVDGDFPPQSPRPAAHGPAACLAPDADGADGKSEMLTKAPTAASISAAAEGITHLRREVRRMAR